MGASYHTNCIDSISNYTSKDQGQTGTCFAYAIAGIIVLASKRVHGRKELDFNKLKDEIIDLYEEKGGGGNVRKILLDSSLLKRYRLRSNSINKSEACNILDKPNPRPIIATFYLNASEWNGLCNFFNKNPNGILKEEDLEKYYNPNQESSGGAHAVIIMSSNFDGKLRYFNIANSWGEDWADKGFFKVYSNSISFNYYDVFWYESDLTDEERAQYKRDYPED